MPRLVLPVLIGLLAAQARADDEELPATFDEYLAGFETTCVGPADGRQAKPSKWELNGFAYEANGARVKVVRKSERKTPGERRLGVLNAIKDDAEETRANVDEFLAKFKEADVDGIVIGGDSAYDEFDMEAVLLRVAASGLPVYAIIGNSESRSSWNRVSLAVHRKHPNYLNLDLVRVVDADGFDFVTMPGYYDKRFTHATSSCVYTKKDTKALPALAKGLEGPVIGFSHGPPLQEGRNAIDFTSDGKNAGDPNLTKAFEKAKIVFGIFGHILEAGGRATDPSGKDEIKPMTWADALYLNPGPANSLPWRMNKGADSYGMAAILSFEGSKARYEVLRSPRRIAVGN